MNVGQRVRRVSQPATKIGTSAGDRRRLCGVGCA